MHIRYVSGLIDCHSNKWAVAEQKIKEMAEAGITDPSTSPWVAPVVLVKKKDGTLRFCITATTAVSMRPPGKTPTHYPGFDDALNYFAGSSWFSSLDLWSSYWQVELAPEVHPKTAFSAAMDCGNSM